MLVSSVPSPLVKTEGFELGNTDHRDPPLLVRCRRVTVNDCGNTRCPSVKGREVTIDVQTSTRNSGDTRNSIRTIG